MTARSVMDTVRSRIMREQEIMWTQFAQDVVVPETVLPVGAVESDREIMYIRKGNEPVGSLPFLMRFQCVLS